MGFGQLSFQNVYNAMARMNSACFDFVVLGDNILNMGCVWWHKALASQGEHMYDLLFIDDSMHCRLLIIIHASLINTFTCIFFIELSLT